MVLKVLLTRYRFRSRPATGDTPDELDVYKKTNSKILL
jgi:hypothetical protein